MTTYETDFYQWTQQQADLLRQGAWSALDMENLIEEIDDMGRSQKNALQSYLFNVIIHLLKWQWLFGNLWVLILFKNIKLLDVGHFLCLNKFGHNPVSL